MSVNPDIAAQAERTKILGVSCCVPVPGELRFAERAERNAPEGSQVRVMLILQQWQWSAEVGDFGWYDIPSVQESDL